MRIATYNATLSRESPHDLLNDINNRSPLVLAVCRIIAKLDADILLLNEFDTVPDIANKTVSAFIALLNKQLPTAPYQYHFTAPVNTGILSPIDFGKDGKLTLPVDGYGFGKFPGQYGMLLLSRYPICSHSTRTFQQFMWQNLPNTSFPTLPRAKAEPYFSHQERSALRLSSKSHWEVVINTPGTDKLHCLCSHPTPPAFDGPEKRNVYRNAAEIDFWTQYLTGQWAVRDDQQRLSALSPDAQVVVLGDLNNDPNAGDGDKVAINGLLTHPKLADTAPFSHRFSTKKPVTASFSNQQLRVDYVLPSKDLEIADSGVFWPAKQDPNDLLFKVAGKPVSDHYPVWVDIREKTAKKQKR